MSLVNSLDYTSSSFIIISLYTISKLTSPDSFSGTMSSVLDRVRQLEEKPSDTTSTTEERLDDGVDVAAVEPIKAEQDVEVEKGGQSKVVEVMKVDSEVRPGSEAGEKGAEVSRINKYDHRYVSG